MMNSSGTPLPAETAQPRIVPLRRRDETDYAHRHFVNLAATALLLAVGFAIVWTVMSIDRYEAKQRCLASGRIDCVRLVEPIRNIRPMDVHPKL